MSNQQNNDSIDDILNIRRKKSFTVKNKLDIIKEIETYGINAINEKYGINFSTLHSWIAEKDKWEEQMDNPHLREGTKRIRTSVLDKLEDALYIWYDRSIRSGMHISGPQLSTKAKILHRTMHISKEFLASEGWLEGWKKKYNLRIPVKPAEFDVLVKKPFKPNLEDMINSEKLNPCQIFNAKTTFLYYTNMPSKTIKETEELNPKESVTVLLCTNADGSCKIPLLIIGKTPKSKVLGNLSVSNTLPVSYTNQKSAWMVGDIFKKWFKEEFVPTVTEFLKQKNLPAKALLLVDNAACHQKKEDIVEGDIKIAHIPTYDTLFIQPMNQGIIEQFKMHYKAAFILELLFAQKVAAINLIDYLKTVTMWNVLYWTNYAWNAISTETIAQCWKNILPDHYNKNYDIELDHTVTNREISNYIKKINGYENTDERCFLNWISSDNDFNIPSDSELIKMVTSSPSEEDQFIESLSFYQSISPQHTVYAADTLLMFCQEHRILSPEEQTILIKARQTAMKIAIQM